MGFFFCLSPNAFGHFWGRFSRFVQKSVLCPYKFEKNRGYFLYPAGNSLNFAPSNNNNNKNSII